MFLFPQAHLWTSHMTPFCQWMEKEDSLHKKKLTDVVSLMCLPLPWIFPRFPFRGNLFL